MLQYLVIVGVLFQLSGSLVYIVKTIRGETKPNKITWFMWSVAPIIGTFATINTGVTWAVLPVFMSGFGPFLIFCSSFVNKNAYWKLEKFDYLCGVFSLLALGLWYITKDPVIAIIFSIMSDGAAAIPTLVKAWKYPETESAIGFLFASISCFIGLLVIKNWVFPKYGFLVYLIITDLSFVFFIWRKKIFKTEKK